MKTNQSIRDRRATARLDTTQTTSTNSINEQTRKDRAVKAFNVSTMLAALCVAALVSINNSLAQVPPGQPPAQAPPAAQLLAPDQLQELVGRIALYPDDLLGLVLPAS